MRIQHNIVAMNSYRNYSAVRGSLGKNLEKLSSGYKINRAGDDAAGLAISEKMRAQITGLTAAQKNVKDGISLVKTAEGAMQEIQDMLNRMDYLATQSANGTYQDEIDRENLQKEVVNLKREIDRIAESANFNGIKLLDGSLKRETSAVAAASSLIGGTASAAGSAVENNAYDSLSLLRLSRTVRAGGSGGTPAKKAVFTFDFNDLAGTYRRGDSITIRAGTGAYDGSSIVFYPNQVVGAGDMNIGHRTGTEIAFKFNQLLKNSPTLKDKWTLDGQTFTWSINGTVLTVEQENAPTKDSELVDKANAAFSVTVNRVDPSTIVGTPKVNAAFGDKVTINAPNQTEFPFTALLGGTRKGTMTLIDFKPDELVNEMRRNGQKGESLSPAFPNLFRVSYTEALGGYYIGTVYDGKITGNPTIIDLAGNILTGDKVFPKSGESVILDFGEIGKIKISADQGLDFDISDFQGGGGNSLWVVTPAASANGGTIKFELTSDQRQRLVDRADAKDVRCPDGSNPTPVDISMQWNTDHFELICGGEVLAKSQTRNVNDTSEIIFFDSEDSAFVVAKASMTKVAADSITDTAFDGGVGTGLQFNMPDYDTITKTPQTITFTPGALEVPPDKPDPPDPPGPDKPDPPDPPGPGPNPPGPGPGPDDPNPPGPDDPDNPGKPDKPDEPGKSGGLILQIGDTSEEYDRMHVFIGDMHTNAMGAFDKDGNLAAKISDVDIGTQSGAQDAIAVIKGAINYVSSVRGDLGAYQNRLEHTGNNLSVSVENIQDAESTIRDTDMAEEIMGYVKHNLFLQYSQAMLAQANVLPEGVLQLLG